MILKPYFRTSNRTVLTISFITLVFILSSFQLLFSQQDTKKRLFSEVDNLLTQAKAEQADLLSPDTYQKAMENYQDAEKDFDKGKNVTKKLSKIKEFLDSAIKNAKIGQVAFSHLLKARDDALEANSIEYAKETFDEAEDEFNDAARILERGNRGKADEKAIKSERLYREAELLAIKVSIIGNVKKQLQESEEKKTAKFAPLTFQKAQDLLDEAESILTSNRSAKTDAKQKAEQAEYEIRHANYLAEKIKTIRKDDLNWEKLILEHEEFFSNILNELDYSPEFDNGFKKPSESAVKAIANLKKQNKELNEEISSMDLKIDQLKDEQITIQNELAAVKQKEEGLRTKLTIEEKRKEKFNKIESLFNKNQAKVLREGNQIKIRLIGLNFASGKSVIDPEYFNMLTKLQRAIRIFPDYHITIEGHTDNKGDDRKNQSLSLRRARAVMSYLIANMGLSESQISARGYGESTPIASNETSQGRAQNRRIDVILSPQN